MITHSKNQKIGQSSLGDVSLRLLTLLGVVLISDLRFSGLVHNIIGLVLVVLETFLQSCIIESFKIYNLFLMFLYFRMMIWRSIVQAWILCPRDRSKLWGRKRNRTRIFRRRWRSWDECKTQYLIWVKVEEDQRVVLVKQILVSCSWFSNTIRMSHTWLEKNTLKILNHCK